MLQGKEVKLQFFFVGTQKVSSTQNKEALRQTNLHKKVAQGIRFHTFRYESPNHPPLLLFGFVCARPESTSHP